jgi:hypothetical protein
VVGFYLAWKGGWTALKVAAADVFVFNKQIPFYWRGHFLNDASPLLSWGAFFVKAPPILLTLFLWALWEIRKTSRYNKASLSFLLLGLVTWAEPYF